MFRLPVSIGDAIDKLTILDIKCENIEDSDKKKYCKEEYDILYSELKNIVFENKMEYKQLKFINTEMWKLLDAVHVHSIKSNIHTFSEDVTDYIKVAELNDARFRIKNILNIKSNSVIREQKGYPTKKALFLCHYGLGDIINMNGAIRYISMFYDETHVGIGNWAPADATDKRKKTLTTLFSDNPSIKFVYYNTHSQKYIPLDWIPENEYSKIYMSGLALPTFNWLPGEECPDPFYRQLGFDQAKIRFPYFHIPTTQKSKDLYDSISRYEYAFVVDTASIGVCNIPTPNLDILVINPNRNMYPEHHKWYNIANTFVEKEFVDYQDTIKHATEIHTVDSAFYCFCNHIPLDAKVAKVYGRHSLLPMVFVNPFKSYN
jgi:hypothetical protein